MNKKACIQPCTLKHLTGPLKGTVHFPGNLNDKPEIDFFKLLSPVNPANDVGRKTVLWLMSTCNPYGSNAGKPHSGPAKPAHCTTSLHPESLCNQREVTPFAQGLSTANIDQHSHVHRQTKKPSLCLCSGHLENHVGMVYKFCYNTGYKHSKYVGRASYNTPRCRHSHRWWAEIPLRTLSGSSHTRKPYLLRHRSNQTPGNNFQHPSSQILLKPASKRWKAVARPTSHTYRALKHLWYLMSLL